MRSSADAPSEATEEDTDEARGRGSGGAPAGLVAAEAQVGSEASVKPGGGGGCVAGGARSKAPSGCCGGASSSIPANQGGDGSGTGGL